jgi:hypothetical protein
MERTVVQLRLATAGGAEANVEAFTDTRWITMRGTLQAYPF